MPAMARPAANVVQVGESDNQQRYVIGASSSFTATSLGYDYNPGGFLAKLGGRGVISYVPTERYNSIRNASCRSGQCMATYLNEDESRGRVGHLVLIPRDEAALATMNAARIASGGEFRLSGETLTFDSGTIDGHGFDGRLGTTGYFLVESLTRE
jgi:hypothetical protein